jgi:hypothetical protein
MEKLENKSLHVNVEYVSLQEQIDDRAIDYELGQDMLHCMLPSRHSTLPKHLPEENGSR